MKYRVHELLPAAHRDPDGILEYTLLPAGAIVASPREVTFAVLGMLDVVWERREYSVLASDLVRKCDPVYN